MAFITWGNLKQVPRSLVSFSLITCCQQQRVSPGRITHSHLMTEDTLTFPAHQPKTQASEPRIWLAHCYNVKNHPSTYLPVHVLVPVYILYAPSAWTCPNCLWLWLVWFISLTPSWLWGRTGGDRDPRRWGERETVPNAALSPPEWWLYLTLHCHHQNDDYT